MKGSAVVLLVMFENLKSENFEYSPLSSDAGVSVFAASSYVSINKKPGCQLIDPEVDLTTVEWSHFKHHDWILLLKCSEDSSSPKVINSNLPLKVITP